MKVAVSSQGTSIEDQIDARFGRAAYFLIVDTETMDYETLPNEQNLQLAQGAGIQAAQSVINKDVNALVTGNCGPKAFATLSAANVEVFVGSRGTVREAVEQFKTGSLAKADSPNVEGHWM